MTPPASPHAPVTEAWIEAIHRRRDRAWLRLLTADGRPEERVVDREDADWLELAPGQIITLAPLPSSRGA